MRSHLWTRLDEGRERRTWRNAFAVCVVSGRAHFALVTTQRRRVGGFQLSKAEVRTRHSFRVHYVPCLVKGDWQSFVFVSVGLKVDHLQTSDVSFVDLNFTAWSIAIFVRVHLWYISAEGGDGRWTKRWQCCFFNAGCFTIERLQQFHCERIRYRRLKKHFDTVSFSQLHRPVLLCLC